MISKCKIPGEDACSVFTLEEFIEQVKLTAFVDSDGSGYFADSEHYRVDYPVSCGSIYKDLEVYPEWATNVVWFNK